MPSRSYIDDSLKDRAIRSYGVAPYLIVYALAFTAAYAFSSPAVFPIPLLDSLGVIKVSAASTWAFIVAYPVFHFLMRPRVYSGGLEALPGSAAAMALGSCVALLPVYFLSLALTDNPSGIIAKQLQNPLAAAGFLAAVSATVSLGTFLFLEPLRRSFQHRF
jgi:cation transport ATPase